MLSSHYTLALILKQLFDFLAFEAEASSALAQELIGSSDGYTGNAEWPIMPPYQPAAQDNTARPCEQALNVLLGYMNEVSSEGPSSRPQDMAWIYKSPCTELYDIEMIEILLSLFQLHVTTTFPVFKHINQPGKLHEGLRLAMAAVGGIYCSTSGASVVAKALFSDARRLLLTFVRHFHIVCIHLRRDDKRGCLHLSYIQGLL